MGLLAQREMWVEQDIHDISYMFEEKKIDRKYTLQNIQRYYSLLKAYCKRNKAHRDLYETFAMLMKTQIIKMGLAATKKVDRVYFRQLNQIPYYQDLDAFGVMSLDYHARISRRCG